MCISCFVPNCATWFGVVRCVNYMHGKKMYIGKKRDTRVRKKNLRGSDMNERDSLGC